LSAEQGIHRLRAHPLRVRPIMRLRPWIVTVLLCLCAPAAAPGAAFASGAAVIRDCADDGALSKRYSQKDYADALRNMPADVDEYTDCRDVIRRAQLGGAGGSGGSGGSSSGPSPAGTPGGTTGPSVGGDPLTTATPEERAAVQQAAAEGREPVEIDGTPITPGVLGGATVNAVSDLPGPVLAVLALLVVGAMAAGAYAAHRLVVRRRSA
jgi:hypothetical protein